MELPGTLTGAVWGTTLALACLGLGGGICRPLFGDRATTATWLPVSGATGFGVLSLAGYLFHSLIRPTPSSVGLLFGLSIAIGWPVWIEVATRGWRFAVEGGRKKLSRAVWMVTLMLTAASVGLSLLKALTPPTEGDALQGYLFTGRWIAKEGLTYNPYNPRYSLMPAGTELVYAYTLGVGGDAAAKLADFWFGLMMVLLVYGLARRIATSHAAAGAAASLMVLPAFQDNWGNGKVDVTASFVFLSAFAVILAEPRSLSLRGVVVGSFLAGTACGQKYSFWIMTPALVAVVWMRCHREGRQNATKLRLALVSCVVIALCLIPHFAKNVLWTGNPVAPFAKDLIPSRNIYLGHQSDATDASAMEWLFFPWTVFFNQGHSPWLGPFPPLLMLGLCCFFSRERLSDGARDAVLAGAAALVFWLAARQEEWLVPRFLLAPIALLLIAAAATVASKGKSRSWMRKAIIAGVAGLVLYFGIWNRRGWRYHWKYAVGLESRDSWQTWQAPHRGYPALHALGPRLRDRQRILIGSSLYNLPEDRLGFASTEAELEAFLKTPPELRELFLVNHGFAYLYDTAAKEQNWTLPLQKAYAYEPTNGVIKVRIYCTSLAERCAPL